MTAYLLHRTHSAQTQVEWATTAKAVAAFLGVPYRTYMRKKKDRGYPLLLNGWMIEKKGPVKPAE